MGTLRQLAGSLGLSNAPIPESAAAPTRPAANSEQFAPESPQATEAPPAIPTAANAPEARRNAWTITRNGKPVCTMVAEPTTYAEALAVARWRWPDANILKD